MTVYGSSITSDIDLPIKLAIDKQAKYNITLLSSLSEHLKRSVTCGFKLYEAHGHQVYLYSVR